MANHIENYITNFIYCVMKLYKMPKEHKECTVFLDCNFSFIDFNISDNLKKKAFDDGYQKIENYIDKWKKENKNK